MGVKSDSPDLSRSQLVKKVADLLFTTCKAPSPKILNMGAGPQLLEREFRRYAHKTPLEFVRARLKDAQLFTMDIADIPQHRLLERDYVPHIRASHDVLPFNDEAFDIIVSNHSIDMLRTNPDRFQQALSEVSRVLRSDGTYMANYHPHRLYVEKTETSVPGTLMGGYFDPQLPNPFYSSEDEIEQDHARAGLKIQDIMQSYDGPDLWWEVSAIKK